MAYANDYLHDAMLSKLDLEVDRICICSAEPTTYTQAITTYKLGYKNSPSISAPADRAGSGRKVTVSAISDGTTDTGGTATHYALVDTVNSRLLIAKNLSSSIGVSAGVPWTSPAFDIGVPDPV